MSFMEEALQELTNGHELDLERGVDSQKKVRGACRLATGIETVLVSAFTNYVHSSIAQSIPYNQLFYIPSRPAEGIVGYDLSIGRYDSDRRIRTMHKVKLETWCDNSWCWRLNQAGDRQHFITLLEHYRNYPRLIPFLIIHVCYCIHDYRRMGVEFEKWQMPPINSTLRTVVISLPELHRQIIELGIDINQPDFGLSISKQISEQEDLESIQSYLDRIAQKDHFSVTIQPPNDQIENCILTLDEFCTRVANLVNE